MRYDAVPPPYFLQQQLLHFTSWFQADFFLLGTGHVPRLLILLWMLETTCLFGLTYDRIANSTVKLLLTIKLLITHATWLYSPQIRLPTSEALIRLSDQKCDSRTLPHVSVRQKNTEKTSVWLFVEQNASARHNFSLSSSIQLRETIILSRLTKVSNQAIHTSYSFLF